MNQKIKYYCDLDTKKEKNIEEDSRGILEEKQNVPIITFPSLSGIEFIKHGFSTRLGGVSIGHLSSMNLSFSRGDDPQNVIENYHRICKALDVKSENLVFSDQVHETKVHVVTEDDRAGSDLQEKKLIGIDGLITNIPGLVLATSYADCVPLYFVDPIHKAIGLSHSGWRGTVGKIGAKTVREMVRNYGSSPDEIIAVIGPSICNRCYEISSDVAEEFQKNFSKIICEQILQEKEDGKYQLDLWKTNRTILLEAGLKDSNISISQICTCCNHDLLYSHRFSNGMRGNLSAFLSIR